MPGKDKYNDKDQDADDVADNDNDDDDDAADDDAADDDDGEDGEDEKRRMRDTRKHGGMMDRTEQRRCPNGCHPGRSPRQCPWALAKRTPQTRRPASAG
eukprot:7500662-Pyramimonas_sp.AAC.1